jgi:hypothetical protein
MMRLIVFVVPLAIIAAVIFARKPTKGPIAAPDEVLHATAVGGAPSLPPNGLAAHISDWVAAGLLSSEEASAILAHEGLAPSAAPPALAPVPATRARLGSWSVAEGLGYLGGMLAIIGLVLVVARYWADMATAGKLGLSGAGAVAFLIAGLAVRERAAPALDRLRGFLWLGSTAAAALFTGVLTFYGFGAEAAQTVVLVAAGVVSLESGLLWRWRDRPIQQATFLAAVAAFTGALVAMFAAGGPVGVALWAVGVGFLVAGLRRWTPLPVLTEGIGSLTVVIGAVTIATAWEGSGLIAVLATALALVAVAVTPGWAPERADQMILGVVGGLTLLEAVPSTLGWFARDAGIVTGLVTWGVGAAVLYVGARGLVRLPVLTEVVGGVAILGGAALTATQSTAFAPVFGIATAVGLVALGMLPGQVLLSWLGSLGLLINVPWTIGRFFPGEGRAPLLILVSGALILVIAVFLSRSGDRFRHDITERPRRKRPPRAGSLRSRRPPGVVY